MNTKKLLGILAFSLVTAGCGGGLKYVHNQSIDVIALSSLFFSNIAEFPAID